MRQGDLLFLYLFIVYAEGLSGLLRKVVNENFIKRVTIARASHKVTKLFFADDSFVFLEGNIDSCGKPKEILEIYESASHVRKLTCKSLGRVLVLIALWKLKMWLWILLTFMW